MPTVANGDTYDWNLRRAHSDNVEITYAAATGTLVRLLAYENHARMGSYADAVAAAHASGLTPDIAADDAPGRVKDGVGLNVEQPLADSGATGLFLRAGWNNGTTQDFVFTEADRTVSAGGEVGGQRRGRPRDRTGFGVAVDALSAARRAYLEAGGLGFLLGDGALDYGLERAVEASYRLQAGRYLEVSPDLQWITTPATTGPASRPRWRASASTSKPEESPARGRRSVKLARGRSAARLPRGTDAGASR